MCLIHFYKRPQMSEDVSKMEVDDPKATDIPALKEAAKEVMEKVESEVNGDKDSKNGDKINGFVSNGEKCENGNGESEKATVDNVGDKKDQSSVSTSASDDVQKDKSSKASEVSDKASADDGKQEKAESSKAEDDNKSGEVKESSNNSDDKEVETINDSPLKKTPTKKKDDAADEPLRRSSRKKTPTKYHELLIKEMEESPSEEEIEEVEEIKDDDSDIQEIEAEDPLGGESSLTITPKNSGEKKPNVVTIDDLKTLQRLATSAKQSMDKAKSDNLMVIDTQSIIAGKMGSGVSITPAKPKTPATLPSSLNITPAGLTLGSGVTIKPNRPASTGPGPGVSVTPVSSNKPQELNDPNLTDDTFVVEAPSFIVPYVYEKPPVESMSDFKEAINKKIEERRKDKEKRKADGEENVSEDEEAPAEKPKRLPDKENKDAFFSSTLGKFFSDLGMNLVQEYVQKDLLRQQQKRSQKDKSAAVMHAIKSLQQNLDDTRENVADFKFDLKKCKFCSFRTESRLVMQHHMETPHMRK